MSGFPPGWVARVAHATIETLVVCLGVRRGSETPCRRFGGYESPAGSVGVVITSLEDLHLFVVGPVNQPVLVVDAAGPVTGQIALQGFRLTYPGERVSLDLTDQARDPPRHLPVRAEPVEEVLPGIGVEVNASHYPPARASSSSMVLTTTASPDLSRATASMSRRALAGDRSR